MNVLRPWGFGKCCACSCCSGGSLVCIPWSEGWSDADEVADNWTEEEPGSYVLVGGTLQAASGGSTHLNRNSELVWFVGSSLGPGGDIDSSSHVGLEGSSGFLIVRQGGDGSWTVDVGGAQTVVFPIDPSDEQAITFEWNQFGDYRVTVGDAITTGTSPIVISLTEATALVSGNSFVGPIVASCDQYIPEGQDFWETQGGQPFETQGGLPWEMQ